MKISYTFRHVASSELLKQHTADKLMKLERYEDREMSVHAIFSTERFRKTVEFQAHGAHGAFVASETCDDMFEAIDVAVDKLDRQLSREKSKRKHHKGHQGSVPHHIG